MNQKRRLIKEDRWSRLYDAGQFGFVFESKFRREGLSFSADQLASEWESWNDSERLRFANAYRQKPEITIDDERILEFLMQHGDGPVRATMAGCLTRHSNKEKVLELLLKELAAGPEFAPNFLHALTVLGDSRAIAAVREFRGRTLTQLEQSCEQPSRDLALALICACRTLWTLEGQSGYAGTIELYLDHPDEVVRGFARACMEEWPLGQGQGGT